jgi:hypothetical protein
VVFIFLGWSEPRLDGSPVPARAGSPTGSARRRGIRDVAVRPGKLIRHERERGRHRTGCPKRDRWRCRRPDKAAQIHHVEQKARTNTASFYFLAILAIFGCSFIFPSG